MTEDGLPGFWTDSFPAFCTHRHAWPLVTIRYLAGIVFDARGLVFRPAIPSAQGPYSYQTSMASVSWNCDDMVWTGAYAPTTAGPWQLVVDLGAHDLGRNASFSVTRTDTCVDGSVREIVVEQRGLPRTVVVVEAPTGFSTASMSFTVRIR